MKKLTQKEAAFVREYLIDLNATDAAKRAGYSARTAKAIASQVLHKPHIKEALQSAIGARAKRTEITADRVLMELARIAFFDSRRLLMPDGSPRQINDLDDDTAAALVGMDILEEFEGSGKDRVAVGYTKKVKVADKVAALGLAMRHLGMLKDKLEVEVNVDLAAAILAARRRAKK